MRLVAGVVAAAALGVAAELSSGSASSDARGSVEVAILPVLFAAAFVIGCFVPKHAWLCGAVIPVSQAIALDRELDFDVMTASWRAIATVVLSILMAGTSAFGSWCWQRLRKAR